MCSKYSKNTEKRPYFKILRKGAWDRLLPGAPGNPEKGLFFEESGKTVLLGVLQPRRGACEVRTAASV